jgi:FkbM family methyltransferase
LEATAPVAAAGTNDESSWIESCVRVPRVVRRATDPLLERLPVPVLAGPNRGRWWNLASAGSGYASGRRSPGQLRFLLDLAQPGDCAWDVGAHHGYVSLALARRVGAAGVVCSFEPGERNRKMLQRHVAWNRAINIAVHPFALGAADGTASFGGHSTSKTLAIGAGSETVQVRTISSLIASGICAPPDFMKVDVENSEADLLAGAGAALPPTLCMVIGVHSRDSDRRCAALLRAACFTCYASPGLMACRTGAWVGDPDLLCIGPAAPADRRAHAIAIAEGAGFVAEAV